MGKRNIAIEIPESRPDDLMHLGENIIAKHTALEGDSPLDPAKITAMGTGITGARAKKKEAAGKHASGEKTGEQMRNTLGIDKGQNSRTKGTPYHHILGMRDDLLYDNKANEQALEEYGYTVVISMVNGARRIKVRINAVEGPSTIGYRWPHRVWTKVNRPVVKATSWRKRMLPSIPKLRADPHKVVAIMTIGNVINAH